MAMSDTGSSFAQWADLYDYGPSNPTGHVSDHSTSPPTLSGSDGSPSRPATTTAAAQQQQQAGGPLISKTIKKKRPSPRASRRAPVTLLNTDAANFRAMVQQFTGVPGPVVSFASSNDYGYAFQPQPAAASFDHHGHFHHQQQQYTGGAVGYGNVLQQVGSGVLASHHGLGSIGSAEDRMLLQSMQQAAAHMPSRNGANGYFA